MHPKTFKALTKTQRLEFLTQPVAYKLSYAIRIRWIGCARSTFSSRNAARMTMYSDIFVANAWAAERGATFELQLFPPPEKCARSHRKYGWAATSREMPVPGANWSFWLMKSRKRLIAFAVFHYPSSEWKRRSAKQLKKSSAAITFGEVYI